MIRMQVFDRHWANKRSIIIIASPAYFWSAAVLPRRRRESILDPHVRLQDGGVVSTEHEGNVVVLLEQSPR